MYKVFVNDIPVLISQTSKTLSKKIDFENLFSAQKFKDLCVKIFNNHHTERVYYFETNLNFDSQLFSPEFEWIEAAGGCVVAHNHLLWIFRLQKWDLPKGKIDKGEKPKESATREVQEECGIKNLKISKELSPTYHVYYFNQKWIIKKTHWFLMESEMELLTPQTNEDITIAQWVPIDNMETQMKNTYPAIRELVENIDFKQFK